MGDFSRGLEKLTDFVPSVVSNNPCSDASQNTYVASEEHR